VDQEQTWSTSPNDISDNIRWQLCTILHDNVCLRTFQIIVINSAICVCTNYLCGPTSYRRTCCAI